MNTERDYSQISPSAKALMLFKSHTSIPYAVETSEALLEKEYRESMPPRDFGFWASVVHFENRYYSINSLVQEIRTRNILELSSGFNFRGLDLIGQNSNLHYIDTDLPEIIKTKIDITSQFGDVYQQSKLEYHTLNALNSVSFENIMNRFDDGPTTIVNEGLLVYLSTEEKKQLCKIIRTQLEKHTGWWITSDIYINHKTDQVGSDKDGKWSKFFGKMNVNQQMFESFEQAQEFFYNNGFEVQKEYVPNYETLSSAKHLVAAATPEQMALLAKAGKVQATWRLVLR